MRGGLGRGKEGRKGNGLRPTFGPLTSKSGGESQNLGARVWIP